MDARKTLLPLVLICVVLSACAPAVEPAPVTLSTSTTASVISTAPVETPSPAPTDPVPAILPELSAEPARSLVVVYSDAVPATLSQQLELPPGFQVGQAGERPDVLLYAGKPDADATAEAQWVYAAVAPFPTLPDEIELDEIRLAWQGKAGKVFPGQPLLVSRETAAALSVLFGAARGDRIRVLPEDQLLAQAWKRPYAWAILPFEQIGPRWKVLRVGGQSPLSRQFRVETYPLVVNFRFQAPPGAGQIDLPRTNRDPEKLTVLVMTGVTALVREIAEKMEEKGVLYPAGEIREWLASADITHISNEVSFDENCPDPVRRDPNFCSAPKYLDLLDAVGTDVVELTGNHLLDRGQEPFLQTLALYAEVGWNVYGGGVDLARARAAITLEDHGNRLAFIGCNPAGPESDWATETGPGSATCDYDWMKAEISRLRGEGFLVIATLQHVEVCTLEPHQGQQADFKKLSDAGAVIVSGSQAHCPQSMAFSGDQFLHYGLGNLFFDQMDMCDSRVMLDRHVIYNGRHSSTELLTAQLEDRAQPRPMTLRERQKLLEDVFRASGWIR